MSIQLPEDVAWALNLLGFMWPQADEDKLRTCAQAWHSFGAELDRVKQEARLTAAEVSADNSGDSIDSFERYWHGVGGSGGDFDRAKESADHMAAALDGMAVLVEGVKIAIIAQLTLLAGEIVADQLLAIETLGASEAVGAGEVIATRLIVRRIIQEAIQRIGREIVNTLKGRVLELFRRILATALRRAAAGALVGGGGDLARQEIEINVFHSRTRVDLGELGVVTVTGGVVGVIAPGRVKTHRGPRVVEVNGYRYKLDRRGRPTKIDGRLVSSPGQRRNPAAQLAAGHRNRLGSDEGGHYVARRFNGPLDDFNHFAQDTNFNRGEYKRLENKWQRHLDDGKAVYVVIEPRYNGDSLRPDVLKITYSVDGGAERTVQFHNRPGGR